MCEVFVEAMELFDGVWRDIVVVTGPHEVVQLMGGQMQCVCWGQ